LRAETGTRESARRDDILEVQRTTRGGCERTSDFCAPGIRRPRGDEDLRVHRADGEASGDGSSFEQAVRAGLAAVMTAPEFLSSTRRKVLSTFRAREPLSYFL